MENSSFTPFNASSSDTLQNVTSSSILSRRFTLAFILEYISIMVYARRTILSLALFLGLFGNVMSIIVFSRGLRTKMSSAIDRYFLALAVLDLCVNLTGPLTVWLGFEFGIKWPLINTATCKLSAFLMNACATASNWILLAMVTQRTVSVIWPHRVNVLCTVRRTNFACLVIIFFAFVSPIYYLIDLELQQARYGYPNCDIPHEHRWINLLLYRIFAALRALVMCVCLPLCNVILIWKLRVSAKEMALSIASGNTQQADRERKTRSITLTAVVTSVAAVVFTLPSVIYNLIYLLTDKEREAKGLFESVYLAYIQAIIIDIAYLNYSVNFYIYCLTGRRFRQEFKAIIWGFLQKISHLIQTRK